MNDSLGKILIVEDDTALRKSVKTPLSLLGFFVDEAGSGEEALMTVRSTSFEAILLDINMPGIGGIETCKRLRRAFTRLPIIMLTVREEEDDKVNALEAGADDYITKPFQIRELTARVKAAVRRYRAPERPEQLEIVNGEIRLDPVRRRVEKNGEEVHLTPREFEALHALMCRAGRPITHAKLLSQLRGDGAGVERGYLRVLIGQLRKKLEADPSQPEYILTDSYIGYRFRDA
jgi:two-component system, OmpR family, KDP operon response regulator KdpE